MRSFLSEKKYINKNKTKKLKENSLNNDEGLEQHSFEQRATPDGSVLARNLSSPCGNYLFKSMRFSIIEKCEFYLHKINNFGNFQNMKMIFFKNEIN